MHYISFRMFEKDIIPVRILRLSIDIFYVEKLYFSDEIVSVHIVSHILNNEQLYSTLKEQEIEFGSMCDHITESTMLHNNKHIEGLIEAYKAYKRNRTLTELIG